MDSLRILIADDHPLFRRGISALLSSVPDFEIVGQASTGGEAAAMTEQLQPDLVLMDLQMPGGSGITATRQIAATCPSVRVLVVTLFEDDESVFMALRAGARGYILKDTDEEEMMRAIRAVAHGEAIFSAAVATRVLSYFSSPRASSAVVYPSLTEREREVLDLIAQGYPNPSIARRLGLSVKTVGNHVSSIFGKLQVADRAEAIIRAREAGMGQNRQE